MKSGRSLTKSILAVLFGWIAGTLLSAVAQAQEAPEVWTTSQKTQCEEILQRELGTYAPLPTDEGTSTYYCRLASEAQIPMMVYTACLVDTLLTLHPDDKYAAPYYCLNPQVGRGREFRRRVSAVAEAFAVDTLNAMALVQRNWEESFQQAVCTRILVHQTEEHLATAEARETFRTFALNQCQNFPAENQTGLRECLEEMDTPTWEAFGLETVAQHCVQHADNGYNFAFCFTYGVPNGCAPPRARARDTENLASYCANWTRDYAAPECPGLPATPTRED